MKKKELSYPLECRRMMGTLMGLDLSGQSELAL